MVCGRCPRSTGRQFTTACSAVSAVWSQKFSVPAARRCCPTPLCGNLWVVSTFITKAFIAASCHGVVFWFFRQYWVVFDPRVSPSCGFFVHLVIFTRYFSSRVLVTFSLFLVIVTCFAMSFALRSAAIARLILVSHCTRERPTLLNFADQSFF